MDIMENSGPDGDQLKQLQRALFYESQFRNAIVADAVSFYDANITRDVIESDFFFRDEENDFVSVPDYLGITPPCKFSDFMSQWFDLMVPNHNQKMLKDISVLREKLLDVYSEGQREYIINYWAENIKGIKTYYNHRFLLTCNEAGEVCALSIIKDSTKLHELDEEGIQQELEQYAYFDPITNGYNYVKFKEEVRNHNIAGSIISLDIHSFKVINSICGITKGDEVIKYIWQCILKVIDTDKNEIAAHINADHYIVFLPYMDEEEVTRVLKNITLSLLIISVDLDVPEIHPYFGISKWAPGKKIELSYNEAITAKHNAKYQMNTNYSFFNEQDTLRLVHEKKIVDSFEKALAKKEFEVWFQPKYSPKDRKLVGAEALVRWVLPDGKIITPDEFIPIFERNNMIRSLDEYIFRNVCHFQKKCQLDNKRVIPISVNLSRASLYYKGIAERYKKITEISQINTNIVPIEITESATVANDEIKAVIENFHKCGFSIHMDDFGSGYSSLASLNLMHFDTIKLDKSLVDFIGEFGGDRLIEHTISLAKEMGIQITAEGVENEAQVKFLKNIGCDSIQGYFYSKPVPLTEFSLLLDKSLEEEETVKIDLVEEHLYVFNQNYYKPALASYVINLTKNELTEHTDHIGIEKASDNMTITYTSAIEKLVNRIHPDYRPAFLSYMDRDKILCDFARNCGSESKNEMTTISQFVQIKPSSGQKSLLEKSKEYAEVIPVRIINNTFKVADSEDIWLYIKVFTLSK